MLDWLKDQDHITLLIALAGFILSLSKWITDLIKNKCKIEIEVIDYLFLKRYPKNVVQFFIRISNKSAKPVSITSINYDGITCELKQKKIIGGLFPVTTSNLPANLPPYSSQSMYLEFVDVPNNPLSPGKVVTFEIHSIWKSVLQTVSLGNISHYLHNME